MPCPVRDEGLELGLRHAVVPVLVEDRVQELQHLRLRPLVRARLRAEVRPAALPLLLVEPTQVKPLRKVSKNVEEMGAYPPIYATELPSHLPIHS